MDKSCSHHHRFNSYLVWRQSGIPFIALVTGYDYSFFWQMTLGTVRNGSFQKEFWNPYNLGINIHFSDCSFRSNMRISSLI
jgi:hypothetical protein